MKYRHTSSRQTPRSPAGLHSLPLRRLRLCRPSNCLGIFFLLLFAATTVLAETEVLYPAEEGYIQGGTYAEQVMDGSMLVVAARNQATKENTRKAFLLFETFSDNDGVNSATLKLTRGNTEVANEGDARVPIDLLLFGAPGGDWMGATLTWASAPFHNPESFGNDETPGLELLARISVDTSRADEYTPMEFSDPRLTEFLRKNPGRVTLVVTSDASTMSPGLWFLGTKGTGMPERRPQLVLEMK